MQNNEKNSKKTIEELMSKLDEFANETSDDYVDEINGEFVNEIVDDYADEASEEISDEFDEEINDEGLLNTKDDEYMEDISNELKSQVREEMDIFDTTELPIEDVLAGEDIFIEEDKKNKRKKIAGIVGITVAVFTLFIIFLVATKPGQNLLIKLAAWHVSNNVERDEPLKVTEAAIISNPPEKIPDENESNEPSYVVAVDHTTLRKEEHVLNILLFGIEEIDGARNTDSIMLATVNTITNQIFLCSFMRDTYVEIPGYYPDKLNAAYAKLSTRAEGANLLMRTIENTYHIKIDGYASVDFDSFEEIIDMLGGVTIELTEREANYLNVNNYISKPKYRNVRSGVQTLNGNQALGYCRVRFIPTLGGANNDYGRTVRQRRVMNAIFEKYKSKGVADLLLIGNKLISYVRTDLNFNQIETVISEIYENGIPSLDTTRIPADNLFYDSGKQGYNGISYALVPDIEANVKYLYQLLFNDTEEEAALNYVKYVTEANDSIANAQ